MTEEGAKQDASAIQRGAPRPRRHHGAGPPHPSPLPRSVRHRSGRRSGGPRPLRGGAGAWRWAAPLVVSLVALLPFVAAVRAWSAGWEPTGDTAIIGLRSLDAWGPDAPLVGQPTTGDTYADVSSSHPGPVEYWVIGPFVRAAGPALGMLVGTALMNGAALGGLAWLAHRRGGPPLLGITALAVTALVRSLGVGSLVDPFNSELVTYPLLLTVLAAWSVALGDRQILPVLAAAATLVAQVHVTGAATVAPVLLATGVMVVVQVRRGRPLRADERSAVSAAGALLAITWLPVAIREVQGPSNIAALWTTWRTPHINLGASFAVDRLFSSLFPPAFVISPGSVAFVGGAGSVLVLLAAVTLGGTGALALHAWLARGRRSPAVLALLGGTVLLATLVTTAGAPPLSAVRSDVTRATWVVSLLVWLTLAWTGWQLLAQARRRQVAPGLAVVCAISAAVIAVVAVAGYSLDDQRDGSQIPTAGRLADRTLDQLDPGTYRLVLDGEVAVFSLGPALALRLEAGGRHVRVAPGPFGEAYGPERATDAAAPDGTIRVVSGTNTAPEPDEKLVAELPLSGPSSARVSVFYAP